MNKKCSANTLKLLAVIAMTADHTAVIFAPENSLLYYFLRLFGRLTAPVMAFFIAEGYRYTRSRKNYLLRLAVFGLISQPSYYIMVRGRLPDQLTDLLYGWNVMISLAAALLCLIILESGLPEILRLFLLSVCITLSFFQDWSLMIPVWALIFHVFRKDFRKQAILFAAASVILQTAIFAKNYDSFAQFTFQYGTLFALIPLSMYNGERGSVRYPKLNRWFFYVYYPAHTAVLLAIRVWLS